jgi:hypothetical protein
MSKAFELRTQVSRRLVGNQQVPLYSTNNDNLLKFLQIFISLHHHLTSDKAKLSFFKGDFRT